MTASTHIDFQKVRLAFIGGGNMASAILGGLLRQGLAQSQVVVIEPFAETAAKLQTDRVVRSMPNTPALVGQGMTGLFPRAGVSATDKQLVEQILKSTGEWIWVKQESDLDVVTALSGSGPAYVFYFLEAMTEAGVQMGLSQEQAYHLAKATFGGATHLARQSTETPEVLRQRVTSKGGTTYAALTSMADDHVKEAFVKAMLAAQKRSAELGDEFGKD